VSENRTTFFRLFRKQKARFKVQDWNAPVQGGFVCLTQWLETSFPEAVVGAKMYRERILLHLHLINK
jgi:hypothetical protein